MHVAEWAKVPKHLLDTISGKLESFADYLQFGSVCLSWHWVIKHNQIKHMNKFRRHQAPMLLTSDEDEHTWSLYDVNHNTFSKSKFSIPYNKRFSGSSLGWLLTVNEDYTVTLYKACSMVKGGENISICLPALFPPEPFDYDESFTPELDERSFEVHAYHVSKMLVTADPLTNKEECTVVVIYGDRLELAFFRLAKDTTWTKLRAYYDAQPIMVLDILYANDIFYAVNEEGAVISFDVTDSCDSIVRLIAPKTRRPSKLPRYSDVLRYIVESDRGELLQVMRYVYFRDVHECRTTVCFLILRLDFKTAEWILVEDLGDVALFLGGNASVSITTSKFAPWKPNRIYITHDLDGIQLLGTNPMICDLGVYHLKTRKFFLCYSIDSDVLIRMRNRPPIWVVPTINEY